MDPRDQAAEDYDTIAADLEKAASHARIAAQHMRERNIPSSAAHTVALIGHLEIVKELVANRAKVASRMAQV